MKKLVFPFLGVWMLGFSGCIKTSDNIVTFSNEPVIVVSNFFSPQPMIETRYGTFLATELSNEDLFGEEILWTNFQINYDQQPYSDVFTVSNLSYRQIFSSWVDQRALNDVTDDGYNDPIDNMYEDVKSLRSMLFFWFRHRAPKEQSFDYEMFYETVENSGITTLYIRAKKTDVLTDTDTEVNTCHGFDIGSLLNNYENAGANEARFNVMYYTGKDKDGKDIYQKFNSTPIIWYLSE